jgi:DNA polymerase-3 subunit gamma/tau
VAELAQRLGAATAVRAMERLGEMLVEMRHAPDPRLLLEVALVQLTHQAASNDISALLDRLDRLEHQVASGVAAAPPARPAPVDPATGRAALGGRARAAAAPAAEAPAAEAPPAAPPANPPAAARPTAAAPPAAPPAAAAADAPPAAPSPAPVAAAASASSGSLAADATARWAAEIKPKLKGLARALYSNTTLLGERDGAFALGVANEATRTKCLDHRVEVESAIAAAVGGKVALLLVVHTGAGDHDDEVDAGNNVVPLTRAAAPAPPPPADEDVDLDDLVEVPPESVVSPLDRLTQAFPGSHLVDE